VLKTSSATSKKNSRPGTSKAVGARLVYSFGGGKADGNEGQKDLLGGKGANLHGMTKLGLPVPPGFTISTDVCTYFYGNSKSYPKHLEGQVEKALRQVEKQMNRKFGGRKTRSSSPSVPARALRCPA
jgi:pyruvate,orthophosphate dikinase